MSARLVMLTTYAVRCVLVLVHGLADRGLAFALARVAEMRTQKNWIEGANEADEALKEVQSAMHPSRALVERIILDEAVWPFLYNEWRKLLPTWPPGTIWLSTGHRAADKVAGVLHFVGRRSALPCWLVSIRTCEH